MVPSQGRSPRGLPVPLEPAQVTPEVREVPMRHPRASRHWTPGDFWRMLVAFTFKCLIVQRCLHQKLVCLMEIWLFKTMGI